MGRPAKYTREQIVDRVLPVFWRHGLEGTTLEHLEAATDLGRQSLYHQFRDKADLYQAALARYQELSDQLLAEIQPPRDDLASVPRFFRRARAFMATVDCRVCLAASVAAGSEGPAECRQVAQATVQRVRQGFRTLCATVASRGDLRPGLTPEQAADLLWATGNGAAMLAAVAGEAAAEQTIDHVVQSLRPYP